MTDSFASLILRFWQSKANFSSNGFVLCGIKISFKRRQRQNSLIDFLTNIQLAWIYPRIKFFSWNDIHLSLVIENIHLECVMKPLTEKRKKKTQPKEKKINKRKKASRLNDNNKNWVKKRFMDKILPKLSIEINNVRVTWLVYHNDSENRTNNENENENENSNEERFFAVVIDDLWLKLSCINDIRTYGLITQLSSFNIELNNHVVAESFPLRILCHLRKDNQINNGNETFLENVDFDWKGIILRSNEKSFTQVNHLAKVIKYHSQRHKKKHANVQSNDNSELSAEVDNVANGEKKVSLWERLPSYLNFKIGRFIVELQNQHLIKYYDGDYHMLQLSMDSVTCVIKKTHEQMQCTCSVKMVSKLLNCSALSKDVAPLLTAIESLWSLNTTIMNPYVLNGNRNGDNINNSLVKLTINDSFINVERNFIAWMIVIYRLSTEMDMNTNMNDNDDENQIINSQSNIDPNLNKRKSIAHKFVESPVDFHFVCYNFSINILHEHINVIHQKMNSSNSSNMKDSLNIFLNTKRDSMSPSQSSQTFSQSNSSHLMNSNHDNNSLLTVKCNTSFNLCHFFLFKYVFFCFIVCLFLSFGCCS